MSRDTIAEKPGNNRHPGERIGNYALEKPLGSGGFAEVWRATDLTRNSSVAMKIFFNSVVYDPAIWSAIREEPKKQPEHDRIVPIYYCHLDLENSPGPYYVVMKLMPGGTLDELLEKRGKLPADEAVSIIRDVLSGLDFAHSRGIIHRDIKPTNILFDSNGRASLADFGIAKDLNETSHHTVFGAVKGTAAYMSPEQGEGKPVNKSSDIYSLGTVLYEMLAGKLPFDGPTDTAIIIARSRGNAPGLRTVAPEVPDRLEKVVLNCLEADLEHRYPDGTSLAKALDWALQKDQPAPTIKPALEQPPKSHPTQMQLARRSKVGLIALVAAMFLVVGSGAAFLAMRHGSAQPGATTTQASPKQTPPPLPTPIQWTTVNFNDSRLEQCSGSDQGCIQRKQLADKLRATNWRSVPIGSPLFRDCMGYPPCEGRQKEVASAGKAKAHPVNSSTADSDSDEKADEKTKIFRKQSPEL